MPAVPQDTKSLLTSSGLPYSCTMESASPLQAWFAKKENLIRPIICGVPELENLPEPVLLKTGDNFTPDVKVIAPKSAIVQSIRGRKKHDYFYSPSCFTSLANNLQKNANVLSLALAADSGFHISRCRKFELNQSVQLAAAFAVKANKVNLENLDNDGFVPVGIVGIVPSSSSPLLSTLEKILPALLTKNDVVLFAPFTVCRTVAVLMDVILQSGFEKTSFVPAAEIAFFENAVNILHLPMQQDFDRSKIAVNTGEICEIRTECVSTYIAIVGECADLDSAAASIVDNIFYATSGSSRVLVHESIMEDFIELVKSKSEHIRIGHHFDKSADYSFTEKPGLTEKRKELNKLAVDEGAEIISLGRKISVPKDSDAECALPSIFHGLGPASTVFSDERSNLSAAAVFPFRTIKEAMALCNNCTDLIQLSIWSENINIAFELARGISASKIAVNSSPFEIFASSNDYYQYIQFQKDDKKFISTPTPSAKETASAKSFPLFYGGKKVPVEDDGTTVVGRNGTSYKIPQAAQKDVAAAINAAISAFNSWGKSCRLNRSQILMKLNDALAKKNPEFIQTLSNFSADATKEMEETLRAVKFWALDCVESNGTFQFQNDTTSVTTMAEPRGVIGIALPKRNSLLAFAHFVIGALAHGNAVVVVAHTENAAVLLDLCQVFEAVGFPAGVLNIISGDQESQLRSFGLYRQVNNMWFLNDLSTELWNTLQTCSFTKPLRLWRADCDLFNVSSTPLLRNAIRYHAQKLKDIFVPALHTFA